MSPSVLDRTRQKALPQRGKKADPELKLGRPPNFLRLQRFFQSQSALATALGVHRDTLRKWERGDAARLRKRSVERVAVMCAVAEQVARYMPRDELVGSWLLHSQPALNGAVPAELVRRHGMKAYETIVHKAAAIAEPVRVGSVEDLARQDELPAGRSAERGKPVLARGAELADRDPDFASH